MDLREGDVVILNFALREFVQGADIHHRWVCRVHKSGVKVITVRPKGVIQKQTGLPVVLRDFSVSGAFPRIPISCRASSKGAAFCSIYPRLFFRKDLAIYKPNLPPVIPVIGEIVRGGIDSGKDSGRLANFGVTFRFDPAEYDPMTYEVRSWEPLRALRESPHFKEIHRALNGLLAYLER